MSELPTSWAATQLGELVSSIVGGGTPSKSNAEYFRGAVPFMTVKDMHARFILDTQDHITEEALEDSASRLIPADTLIVASRMSLGKIARPKVSVAINQDLKALFLRDGIDKTYVEYAWRAKETEIQGMGTGTTVKGIRLEDIRGLDIVLAPSGEQTRIANQLDTLLARVQACNDRFDAIPALLKRFRQTVLDAATSGRLTEDWRTHRLSILGAKESGLHAVQSVQEWKTQWLAQNPTHNESPRVRRRVSAYTPPRIDPDLALPEEWVNMPLEDAILMVVDCHNKTAPYRESGIPLIRTSNIRDGKFVWDDLRYVDEQTYAFWSKRCLPRSGDLIFTREAPIGEVAITPPNMKLCLGQRTMLLRPIEHLISARYIQICLMTPAFRKNSEIKAVGSGVKHYRVGDVSELEIPIPSFSEQSEIVRRVDALFALADRIEARCTAARAQAQRLSPLVLAKAFRGELVPQDASDEPASVLLQRMAAAPPAKVQAPRGGPRSQKKGLASPPPFTQSDWLALPDGAWHAPADPEGLAAVVLLTAVLKAWGTSMPQMQARLATLLCQQPRLFTAVLPADQAAQWRRLVGVAADPLPAQVSSFQPPTNNHWRRALVGMRARGDLIESAIGLQETWALGPGTVHIETAGWPEGRAGWVVAYLRAHGVEVVLPLLEPAAQEFVNVKAA